MAASTSSNARCCRCAGSGSCIRCSCAVAGNKCKDCYPSRKGRCLNRQQQSVTCPPQCQDGGPPNTPCSGSSSIQGTMPTVDPQVPSGGQSESLFQATGIFPDFIPCVEPNFMWGSHDGGSSSRVLNSVFKEVIHWKRNLFKIPLGRFGKLFTAELSRLYSAFATGSAIEPIALLASSVFPSLMLQNPNKKSKVKAHRSILEKRLVQWENGDFQSLLVECRSIQSRFLKCPFSGPKKPNLSRSFANLMFQGKTAEAIQLLSDNEKGKVLHLDDLVESGVSVKDVLKCKHPVKQPVDFECVAQSRLNNTSDFHPIIFDQIDAGLIRKISLQSKGAAGPSGIDAYFWRRLCTCFYRVSDDLCHSVAAVALRLCSDYVDPRCIMPLLSCRLIALSKNPGVRPIGIGEIVRRVIAKAVLSVVKSDILDTVGLSQLCVGQVAGVEAAVHTVQSLFKRDDMEAALLVDASNAFNSLNRDTALLNIMSSCPSFATILLNCYRECSNLFIDGDVILSQEGTTQGDPLSMAFYALATLPLIKSLPNSVHHIWYADDVSAVGSVKDLSNWWNALVDQGPKYGYFPNSSKSWLVVKESCYNEACSVFSNLSVNVTSSGHPHLGIPLGSQEYVEKCLCDKVNDWVDEILVLSKIASTQPHATYSALMHGLFSRWLYYFRTVPNMGDFLETLESALIFHLIPALIGRPIPNAYSRAIFALPTRLGGLGIYNPLSHAGFQFVASSKICGPIVDRLVSRNFGYDYECQVSQYYAKLDVKKEKRQQEQDELQSILSSASSPLCRSLKLAGEKCASSWLTSLPLTEYGFSLHKRAFFDAIALRYGWTPLNIPTHCACGASFSVDHSLSCLKGGFPIIRHNEIRNLTADLLTEVCHDVQLEPTLQPLTGEQFVGASVNKSDGARLDVSVNGFWGGRFEKTFLDVRVFNPYTPSNQKYSIENCYKNQEREKKRLYEKRVLEVEHASFSPLVFSVTGGMANECAVFYKRLALMLAEKRDQSYNQVICWLRCCLSFTLLKSAIQCIRGARSSFRNAARDIPVDLINSESSVLS